jgi:thiol:disulfide interchange protein
MEGVSRSVTMLSYYFLKRYYVINSDRIKNIRRIINREMYFLPRILTYIKDCRPCICPNSGFVAQLLNIELQLKKWLTNEYKMELNKKKPKKKKKSDKPKKSKKSKTIEVVYDQLSDLAAIAPPKIEKKKPPKLLNSSSASESSEKSKSEKSKSEKSKSEKSKSEKSKSASTAASDSDSVNLLE